MLVTTQDLFLTAFVRLKGIKLEDLRDIGDRKLFVFENSEEFQLLKRKYYFNEAQVDPLDYKNMIRELKAAIMDS